ncbi:MAG: nitrilase family protein [Candidatus Cyclobacteriaceae bacterium M3_2C_046]
MEAIRIATVQFEHKSLDKAYNLSVIDQMARAASNQGVRLIAFHECCISGYTVAQNLSSAELLALAEPIPEGDSIQKLVKSANKYDIVILAGLFEKDQDQRIYNSYVCVDKNGLVARHRKIHPFISPYLSPGDEYTLFNFFGWTCGILICYDNNIIENVRATRLSGAEIIFMPHVTMCTPSTRPGAGFVDPHLWYNRETDPTSLRQEFDGLKGRSWLMKWLPARAYDNAIYVVFSNPIGMDQDQLKNGCSMIIDPFGDILTECRQLNDQFAMAVLTKDKLDKAGGNRYLQARKPALYHKIIGRSHQPDQKVAWLDQSKSK